MRVVSTHFIISSANEIRPYYPPIGVKIVTDVDKPGFAKIAASYLDRLATDVRPSLGYGVGMRVGADAPESSRSRTCVASTKSKRTVPSLNVSPA